MILSSHCLPTNLTWYIFLSFLPSPHLSPSSLFLLVSPPLYFTSSPWVSLFSSLPLFPLLPIHLSLLVLLFLFLLIYLPFLVLISPFTSPFSSCTSSFSYPSTPYLSLSSFFLLPPYYSLPFFLSIQSLPLLVPFLPFISHTSSPLPHQSFSPFSLSPVFLLRVF